MPVNSLRSLWTWLEGKKTLIGISVASAYQFGELVNWWVTTDGGWAVILAIFGIGVIDKVRRS